MKKIIFALSTLALLSCSKENVAPLNEENISFEETTQTEQSRRYLPTENVVHYDFDFERNLIAGQHYTIGTVNLSLTGEILEVTFNVTDPEWTMTETHLYVGSCGLQPMNGQGNPQPGRFRYKDIHDLTQGEGTTYTYSINVVEDGIPADGCIAAHAVVVNSDGTVSHTAWGSGDPYSNNSSNWSMIFGYGAL